MYHERWKTKAQTLRSETWRSGRIDRPSLLIADCDPTLLADDSQGIGNRPDRTVLLLQMQETSKKRYIQFFISSSVPTKRLCVGYQ